MLQNLITWKSMTQIFPGFIILLLCLKAQPSLLACYVLYILTFCLLLLGVKGECQRVALQRKAGGSCGASPPLRSDTVPNSQEPPGTS